MPKIKDKELIGMNSYQRRIARLKREIDTLRKGGIVIGDFRICKLQDGKLWITIYGDGEGGEFNEQALSDSIRHFYAEHF